MSFSGYIRCCEWTGMCDLYVNGDAAADIDIHK